MDFANFITIAADTAQQLRQCDVFRVIQTCPAPSRPALVAWLCRQRPDLCDETQECLDEIASGS